VIARGLRHRHARTGRSLGPVGVFFVLTVAGLVAGPRVTWAQTGTGAPAGPPSSSSEVLRLGVEVLDVLPHDPGAFTQGLLWSEGRLYESTGEYGKSSLRRVDPATGEVEKSVSLPAELFGEGLALVDGKLIQLTWRRGLALVYDAESFVEVDRFTYEGEGWGLCYDGHRLFMSNGTPILSIRDPESFEVSERLQVTFGGRPVGALNELECADGWVYANVYQTDMIVRIDPFNGEVRALIDAAGLLGTEERLAADVLNGIAYRNDKGSFLVTGKYWPKMFEVEFTPLGSLP
jgi:glutamine cyclotransferase